jgi:hypothetical protein
MEALKLSDELGVDALELGVPILAEELANAEATEGPLRFCFRILNV